MSTLEICEWLKSQGTTEKPFDETILTAIVGTYTCRLLDTYHWIIILLMFYVLMFL